MSGSGGDIKIFGGDGTNRPPDIRQCNKSCTLLKDIDVHKAGEALLAEKEDDKNLYVRFGHGCWITLVKGVDAV